MLAGVMRMDLETNRVGEGKGGGEYWSYPLLITRLKGQWSKVNSRWLRFRARVVSAVGTEGRGGEGSGRRSSGNGTWLGRGLRSVKRRCKTGAK